MKKYILFLIILAAVGGGAFYGGMKYAQSRNAAAFQNLSNLTPAERQQRIQEMGTAGIGFRNGTIGNRSDSSFATGEVISKDDKSITVKLPDGGSKIIFYSETTEINKFTSGTLNDIEVGKTIVINGKANQDGSITAQSIQLRPAMPNQ